MPETTDAAIKLYFAPRTRAVRILWLLEELDLPYSLERVAFVPPAKAFFAQRTPTGKLPTLIDDGVVLSESGAIVEYLLERHGGGRLAPASGTQERAAFLQWLHFAESTVFPPLGIIVWLTRYRDDGERHAAIIADSRERARDCLGQVERALDGRPYILGESFSAADVMLGFTLWAARYLDVLDGGLANVTAYLARLEERPAWHRAFAGS